MSVVARRRDDDMIKRWIAFTRFLEDGRIGLTNNAAERALRGLATGREAWLLAGSDRGDDLVERRQEIERRKFTHGGRKQVDAVAERAGLRGCFEDGASNTTLVKHQAESEATDAMKCGLGVTVLDAEEHAAAA